MYSLNKAVKHSSKVKNLLKPFGDKFSKYLNYGCNVTVKCKWKCDINLKTLKWAWKLVERNLKHIFQASSLGWQPGIAHYMFKNEARYLLALDAVKRPVAYSMFMFEMNDGYSVLYCYQLQIERKYQRKGLGRFLVDVMEQLAKYYKVEKLKLMVLLNNKNALRFYSRMHFGIDDESKNSKNDYRYLMKITD